MSGTAVKAIRKSVRYIRIGVTTELEEEGEAEGYPVALMMEEFYVEMMIC